MVSFFIHSSNVHVRILNILGVGTLVFDDRVGLYDDPPSEEATRFIDAVNDVFAYSHILLFGFVENLLLPYVDTPSFKKLGKAMDTMAEIGEMFIKKKIKELEEMADRGDSQENQGEIFKIQDCLC